MMSRTGGIRSTPPSSARSELVIRVVLDVQNQLGHQATKKRLDLVGDLDMINLRHMTITAILLT
eukprot:scaffold6264_cov88-Skeletonema_dohrnii-CCMP3373.AAC.4